jgi:hypothetical protein
MQALHAGASNHPTGPTPFSTFSTVTFQAHFRPVQNETDRPQTLVPPNTPYPILHSAPSASLVLTCSKLVSQGPCWVL